MKKKAKKKIKTAKEAGVYDPKAASKDAMVRISAKRLVELASKHDKAKKDAYKEGWNAAFEYMKKSFIGIHTKEWLDSKKIKDGAE